MTMLQQRIMTINMGPQHPSTHGVLRLILDLDGEIVVRVTPVVGYLHRAIGKIAEHHAVVHRLGRGRNLGIGRLPILVDAFVVPLCHERRGEQ